MALKIKLVTREGREGWKLPNCEKCGRVVNSFDRDPLGLECPNEGCPLEINSRGKLRDQVQLARKEFRKSKTTPI